MGSMRVAQSARERFADQVETGLEPIEQLEGIEVVVGVPIYDFDQRVQDLIEAARRSLETMGLAGAAMVLCTGPTSGDSDTRSLLDRVSGDGAIPTHAMPLERDLEDYRWSVRAAMEVAAALDASLLMFPPKFAAPDEGLDDDIARLLGAVRTERQDLALAHFNRTPLARSVESLLVSPVLAGVMGFRIPQPTPGFFAVSGKLIRECLSSDDQWSNDLGLYGFDPWLVVHALTHDLEICQVPLHTSAVPHGTIELERIFRQVTHSLFAELVRHERHWLDRGTTVKTVATWGPLIDTAQPPVSLETDELCRWCDLELNRYSDTLLRDIVPEELRERVAPGPARADLCPGLSAEQWVRILSDFILAYRFGTKFDRDDVVDGLFPFFLARLANFVEQTNGLRRLTKTRLRRGDDGTNALVRHETQRLVEHLGEIFVAAGSAFREAWRERETQVTSYLPRLGAWEFVPHVGVIMPQELERPDNGLVWASEIYSDLIGRYRKQFLHFIDEQLGIEEVTNSDEILGRVHDFMRGLDKMITNDLFPEDVTTSEGATRMAERVFGVFARKTCFQLTPAAARLILRRMPPKNLIAQLGVANVGGLLQRLEPPDALGMAAWTDRQHYQWRVIDIIDKEGAPDWFRMARLTPLPLDTNIPVDGTELLGAAGLLRLVGRVLVVPLRKGWGGEFPKMWFFLKLVKSIVGVELFTDIWHDFASEKSSFGHRVAASINGHWGREVLSAHNVFENRHHRLVVARLKRYAKLRRRNPKTQEVARRLKAAADVYHLSITLPDATFVPLSLWTWASYSYRGGLGVPTPLSSVVERDWATSDFLARYLKQAQRGDDEWIDEKVVELIGKGNEAQNMRVHLLGVSADPDQLVVHQIPAVDSRRAEKLTRPIDQPILKPTTQGWESRYVLNAGVARLDGTVHILYRAVGDDKVSRIGLAWSRDGLDIDGRLDYPIFEAADPTELAGCEDPRVTVIDDRLYMLYTAWDKTVPQIAMASIPVDAFLDRRFDQWQRHGLGFPGLPNKDAVIYPQKFDGRYVIYHRIDPSMWISYLDELTCPFPRSGQRIVIRPRPGMMWDGVKIGAGAPPIKTTHGWLNIYHGVDFQHTYRLGVLLMALDNPARVIYQSPNAILEPETEFEIGTTKGRDYWVPHVVFTCGAVPATDRDVVGPDDELLVYYGAADTAICVARGRLSDFVPLVKDRQLS